MGDQERLELASLDEAVAVGVDRREQDLDFVSREAGLFPDFFGETDLFDEVEEHRFDEAFGLAGEQLMRAGYLVVVVVAAGAALDPAVQQDLVLLLFRRHQVLELHLAYQTVAVRVGFLEQL